MTMLCNPTWLRVILYFAIVMFPVLSVSMFSFSLDEYRANEITKSLGYLFLGLSVGWISLYGFILYKFVPVKVKYDDEGFTVELNNIVNKYSWNDISKIKDYSVAELLRLYDDSGKTILILDYKMPGFDVFQEAMYKHLNALQVPSGWDQWQAILEKNTLPILKINLAETPISHVTQSKFGGKPYWPKDQDYPVDKEGDALNFIAQINFSEIPEKLDNYPTKGLLQFYIGNDDLYGMEFFEERIPIEEYLENNKKNYAVIYHHEMKEPVESFKADIEKALANDMSPYTGESAISFMLTNDIATPADYRFNKIIEPLGEMSDEVEEYAFDSLIQSPDHKIGGYASFTQEDPRGEDADWLLLFQLDTDSNDHIDIMWGDVGIANFFIRLEDLKRLDFSKVWYNWDCH